ncbi:MAG: phospho-N-acetylmuramoyl-pentapeptide-transferase [Clostridia bacterium]|nr:phospho-N-acetylmuramoyl-pentapeptide-transferase [Clostridia bacterium]
MHRLIWTVVAAFAMAMVLGPIVIPWLKKMRFGKEIYELGPQSHKKKQGTPQMGGIIFALPALIAALAFSYGDARWDFLLIALVSALGFGLIGFVDDFLKIRRHSAEGLTPKQKLAPQILLAIGLSVWGYLNPKIGPALTVPFFGAEWNLGWLYLPVMAFVLVGTVNSANLLDGLDGLLAGCGLFDFATMALICVAMAAASPADADNLLNVAVFAGALAGALMGFLRFNAHPARVFMGDVGSFFIGGALAGMAMVTRLSLLLPVIALAMMLSSLSDLIQFAYFRATHGKRFFKMAPLHHHFELCGMPETRIVAMYHIATAILCLLSLLGFVA